MTNYCFSCCEQTFQRKMSWAFHHFFPFYFIFSSYLLCSAVLIFFFCSNKLLCPFQLLLSFFFVILRLLFALRLFFPYFFRKMLNLIEWFPYLFLVSPIFLFLFFFFLFRYLVCYHCVGNSIRWINFIDTFKIHLERNITKCSWIAVNEWNAVHEYFFFLWYGYEAPICTYLFLVWRKK